MSAFLHEFPTRRFWFLSTVFLALASGCSDTEDVGATDTKTNWLSRCDTDSDCGDGLDCLCGVCTRSCEEAVDCSGLPGASCAPANECSNANLVCVAPSEDDAATPTDDESSSETELAPDAASTVAPPVDAGPTPTSAPSDAAAPEASDASAPGTPEAGAPDDAATPADGGSCEDPSRDYKSRDTETCTLIDFVCEEGSQHFFDDCGCGCEPAAGDAGACEQPGKDYVSTDPEECTRIDFLCTEGSVPFFDDCGCGCEPEAVTEPECPTPEGNEVFAEVLPAIGGECFDVTPGGVLLQSAEQFEQFLQGCGVAPSTPDVDFDTQRVFAATVADRPSVSFLYAVEASGTVHIGVQADAYCGGARPPAGVVLIALDAGDTEVVQDTCFTGECMGPPPP